MTVILGINAYHGDSSACLLINGKLIAAAEEERFRRIKHWAGFPSDAIRYCLAEAGITTNQIEHVAVSRNPKARLPQKALHVLARRPSISFLRDRLKNVSRIGSIENEFVHALDVAPSKFNPRFHNVGHHLAHAASSFFVSPFDEAAIVSIDGFGDFSSTLTGSGQGSKIRPFKLVGFPHSLGILYTALTQYLGFPKYGDEYKVMGLASYGEPEYLDEFRKIVMTQDDGTFKLDLRYFCHHTHGVAMAWNNCEPTLGQIFSEHLVKRLGMARQPNDPLETKHENIAASLQTRLEEIYFHIVSSVQRRTGLKALCLAGGVAFNSVANGKLFNTTNFDDVYIQSAAGDAGTAVGSAFYVHTHTLKLPREFIMGSAYWGPSYSNQAIEPLLKDRGLEYRQLSEEELIEITAKEISEGKVAGWFQGRMEWGPRALGNRSILADPRRQDMKDILNTRIKRREPFRPFAPSILLEATAEWFEEDYPDPFMIKVYPIKKEKQKLVPAVTHVDGTGRLQTVSEENNRLYWKLIKKFDEITGVPMVLNTSFNENEPIVCSPEEALDCFQRTRMDFLAIGNFVLWKNQQSTD